MAGAAQVFESCDGVACCMAAGGRVVGKIDSDGCVGVGVVEPVPAVPSDEAVGAGHALDGVRAAIADDGVAVGGTEDLLESGEGVALGVPAGASARCEVYRDRLARVQIPDLVPALAAVERIGAGAADKEVVARTPDEGAGAPGRDR